MIRSRYIYDILDLMLDGDPDGFFARAQLPHLTEAEIEYTNEGAFIFFDYDGPLPEQMPDPDDLMLAGVFIESQQEQIQAEAVLYFADGIADCLEIFCHDGRYPARDLHSYTLTQDWGLGRVITTEA